MSWDVMIFKVTERPHSVEEMDEENMLPLGGAEEVRAAISAALPTVDWSDPTWGIYDGNGFAIEFSIRKEDPIGSMMLHVHGGGDAIMAIMKVVVAKGWIALDCSTSEFLDPAAPSDAGWVGFQQFRDRALRDKNAEAKEGG